MSEQLPYTDDMPAPTGDEKTAAILAHVLVLVGGFIAPLIVYLVKKDDSKFVRKHAAESLNFQLTLLIVTLICGIILMGTVIRTIVKNEGNPDFEPATMFASFFGIWFIMMAIGIFNFVVILVGTIKASNGQPYKYPIRIPFVK